MNIEQAHEIFDAVKQRNKKTNGVVKMENKNVNQYKNINKISDMGVFVIKFCMLALVLIGISVLVINNAFFSIIGAVGALIAIMCIATVK